MDGEVPWLCLGLVVDLLDVVLCRYTELWLLGPVPCQVLCCLSWCDLTLDEDDVVVHGTVMVSSIVTVDTAGQVVTVFLF